MEKRFRFTNDKIRSLPPNPPDARGTDLEVSDTDVMGLKCLVGKSGNKRWLLRYRNSSGKRRSIALGRFPDIDVSTARKVARKHLAQIVEGIDPLEAREEIKSQPTLSEFFRDTHLPLIQTRNRTWKQDSQRFRTLIEPTLGQQRLTDITVAQVQQLQLKLSQGGKGRKPLAPATCNRALALLKTLGAHAVRLGLVDTNQAAKIPLLQENNIRTRFLDLDESKRLLESASQFKNRSIGGLVAMLLLTGCRLSELRLATYEYLDRKNRVLTIPASQTKNKQGRLVYLTDKMLEVLDSVPAKPGNPYLFPGRLAGKPLSNFRTGFNQILLAAGITDLENICLHTLRHTTASNMVSAGLPLSAVKAQLAHQSIQSSERYAKLTPKSLQQTSEQVSKLFSD